MSGTEAASLKSFIGALPAVERHVLLLHYADGLNSAEIGLALDLPESRVSGLLRQLREKAARLVNRPVVA